MPLTEKGKKILSAMEEEYGSDKKAKEVFYASKNAGKISGVDSVENTDKLLKATDAVGKMAERFDSFLVRRRSGFKTRHDAGGEPSEKQLAYIEGLLGKRDNGHHSDAYAEITRVTGASQKKATSRDASATIESLLKRKGK